MKKRKIFINISQVLLVVFIPIVILLTILQYYCYNEDFFMKEFKKYDIAKVTTMTEDDLNRVAKKLISYLKNESKDLEINAVINGEMEEVFGQREKQHMVDVKELFVKGTILRNIGFGLILGAAAIVIIASRNKKKDIAPALLWGGVVPILFAIILYILLKIDFNKYFTYFHKIFFNNNLWLLNPETDVLIQMLPLEFFIDITIRVIGWFLGISTTIAALGFYNLKKDIATK